MSCNHKLFTKCNLLCIYLLQFMCCCLGLGTITTLPTSSFNQPLGFYANSDYVYVGLYLGSRVVRVSLTTGEKIIIACSGIRTNSDNTVTLATTKHCNLVHNVYLSPDSNFLWLTDTNNHCIRFLDISTGLIHTAIGKPWTSGSVTIGALGTDTFINCPVAMYVDSNYVWFGDDSHNLFKYELSTSIVTYVYNQWTRGVYVTPEHIWIMLLTAGSIKRISRTTESVETMIGGGPSYVDNTYNSNKLGTNIKIGWPGITMYCDVMFCYFPHRGNNRIFRYDLHTGRVNNVVGNGGATFAGDNGPATSASLCYSEGFYCVPALGKCYASDLYNYRLRVVDAYQTYASLLGDPHFTAFDGRKYSFSGCVLCLYVLWQDAHFQWNGQIVGRPGLHHARSRYLGCSYITLFGYNIIVDPKHLTTKVNNHIYKLNRYHNRKIRLGPKINKMLSFMRIFRKQINIHVPCMTLILIPALKSTTYSRMIVNCNHLNAQLKRTHWSPYCKHPIGLMGDLFKAKGKVYPTGPNGEGILDHKAEYYRIECPFCKLNKTV